MAGVEKESVMIATGSINCPKCGHAQEERLDCRKCGVVFSKYYALYPSSRQDTANGADESSVKKPPELDQAAAISDLQQQVRELSARFADIEFEKAERGQLRADLKNLDHRLQDMLDRMALQLEQFEKRFKESPVQGPKQESGVHLPALLERLKQLEEKLQSLGQITSQTSSLDEKTAAISQLISELQGQHSALREQVVEMKSQLELVRQAERTGESKTPLEDDVHAIRKNLDELRQLISTASKSQ